MNAEDRLAKSFNSTFCVFLSIIIVCFVLGLILLICRNKILALPKIKLSYKILYHVFIGALFVGSIVCSIFFVPYARDKNAVDNEQFITITGELIDWGSKSYGENGRWAYSNPIIKIEGSDGTIMLKIGRDEGLGLPENPDIKIGETYTFIYLNYTRMGAVKTI